MCRGTVACAGFAAVAGVAPWLACLALLSELEAQVQQEIFVDERWWSRSWLEPRQQTVSGQRAYPGPHPRFAHVDGSPVRKGSAPIRCYHRRP